MLLLETLHVWLTPFLHLQVFCSNLEQLILWLYRVVDRIQSLTPATADISSVRSCLANYKVCYHIHDSVWGGVERTPFQPIQLAILPATFSFCQSFQKDISARQPLTTAVLKTGDALLSYLNSTSPGSNSPLLCLTNKGSWRGYTMLGAEWLEGFMRGLVGKH